MLQLLKGKVAVVTGSGRGIGRSVCELFSSHGAIVIACVRQIRDDQLAWQSLLNLKGADITLIEVDITDSLSIKKTTQLIRANKRIPNILVNCAGAADGSTFQMTSVSKMRALFETNVFGLVEFSQNISRQMARSPSGGAIINLSSIASKVIDPGTMAYGASKIAVERVSLSMAVELAAHKIRVNVISPGATDTDMARQMDPCALEKLVQASLQKKIALPIDIANSALFLASDLSSHITGQIIHVDGGILQNSRN